MAKAERVEYEDLDEDVVPAAPNQKRSVGRKKSIAQRLVEEGDEDIYSWLARLGAEVPVRVKIVRAHPKVFAGKNIGGTQETVDEAIEEEYIKERWGGGKFRLHITRQNEQGSFVFAGQRTVEIGGDPLWEGRPIRDAYDQQQAGSSRDNELANRAFETMQEQLDARVAELHEIRNEASKSGFDPTLLKTLQEPLLKQIESLERQMERMGERLHAEQNREPDPFQQKFMAKMFDEDNARINALREQHASELRQLRESHKEELKDQRRAHERELDRLVDSHKREIDLIRETHKMSTNVSGSAAEVRLDTLRARIDDLNRDLAAKEAELQSLRAKKDKTLFDQIEEIDKIKELIGGDGEKDEKWYERLTHAVMSSPAVLRLVGENAGDGLLADGPKQPQQLPAQQQAPAQMPGEPPPGVPFQVHGEEGIFIRQPDGQLVKIPEAEARKRQAALEAREKAKQRREGAEGGEVDAEDVRAPDPEDVKMAITFMEGALQNGQDPEQFARTAASLIPADILRYIQKVGVDEFLNKVASLEPGSPLTQQHGRNFARKVGKVLIGDAQ